MSSTSNGSNGKKRKSNGKLQPEAGEGQTRISAFFKKPSISIADWEKKWVDGTGSLEWDRSLRTDKEPAQGGSSMQSPEAGRVLQNLPSPPFQSAASVSVAL
jgi:hypothetical protein